jgi:hypothetical protein
MAKKKITNDEQIEAIQKNDETLIALKERWFKLAREESYPNTKLISQKLDKLEIAISDRKTEIVKNYGNT